MRILKDKILVKISAELRESIYSKEVTTVTGEKVQLWKAAKAVDYLDERISFLNVQTAVVEEVGEKIDWIKKGDIALINYDICNSPHRIYRYEGDATIYFLEVNTTYHQEDEVAWENQKTNRHQIVHLKGDYDQLSGLLGIIRGEQLIANAPYIFFKHESNIKTMVSPKGMMYETSEKIIEREILAISKESSEKYGVRAGDKCVIDDFDELAITAINDVDILAV
jgi:hypothetical protein